MKRMALILFLTAWPSYVFATGGFGGTITGGAGGPEVTVTTAEELHYYVDKPDNEPYVIWVQATIDLGALHRQRIRMRSNKTIRGVMGTSPTIVGQISFRDDATNIIIKRLTITNPDEYGEGDGLNIRDRVSNVLITRCTLYDCSDGLIDITSQSDNITVSWCKFYFTDAFTQLGHGNRVSLIGASDDSFGDEGKLHVTFHHNWFGPNSRQRIPSVRFGRVHLYNNFYDCPGNMYGIISRIKAECRIENNYFRQINDPYYVYVAGESPADYGKIAASGNLFENCTGRIHPGDDTVFTPPYDYTLDPTEWVPVIVRYGAGADGNEGEPPHWLFGMYGDFNLDGRVDEADLLTLLRYWLAEEDISNVDYNGDGIVNTIEFALFAHNWLRTDPDLMPPQAPQNLWALSQNGQVTLNWTANPEPDINGYIVYRSTTSGSDYQRLNETPLPLPGYTDTDVVIGTMYYYVIRAADFSGNLSDASVEGCALPVPGPANVILQEHAVGFCGVEGIVNPGQYAGFTGPGFSDTINAIGAGINWRINIVQEGSYLFRWRYANGSGDRPGRLLINGQVIVPAISFPGTGGWNKWSELSVGYALTPGIKDIRLEAVGDEGLGNIDYLRVSGPSLEAVACE